MLNVYVLVQDGLSWLESAEQINCVLSYYYHIFTTKAENTAKTGLLYRIDNVVHVTSPTNLEVWMSKQE